MVDGRWLMVDGRWLMVDGDRSLRPHQPSTINHQPLSIPHQVVFRAAVTGAGRRCGTRTRPGAGTGALSRSSARSVALRASKVRRRQARKQPDAMKSPPSQRMLIHGLYETSMTAISVGLSGEI